MRSIALLGTAAALAAATSVVGLEHGNVPLPRRRRVKPAPVLTETDYTWLEQRELQKMEGERKKAAAAEKRARKGEKLKKVAEAGGIGVVEAKADPVPAEKPKRARAKTTTI